MKLSTFYQTLSGKSWRFDENPTIIAELNLSLPPILLLVPPDNCTIWHTHHLSLLVYTGLANNTAKEKTGIVKAASTTMETNGSLAGQAGNGNNFVGDHLTARNHSRHENENSEQRRQSSLSSGEDYQKASGIISEKKPYLLHQTLSMDDGTTTMSSRISNGGGGIINAHQQQFSLLKWSFYLLMGGVILGLALPKNPHLPSRSWQILSNVVGYTYFLAWSLSFYPQIFLNHQRRTTHGLSVDFCVLNVLGYICYTIYTTNFFWNENVISAYRERNSGGGSSDQKGEITVQGNDVAFAIHAILMASVTLSQIGIYDTFTVRPPSKRVYIVLLSTCTFCILYLLSTWIYHGHIDVLGFLYVLGTIKIGVTIGKYVPQALLNRSRKSTVGWNVWNVILDFTGGVLSLVQLVGDCSDMNDWSGITGNPAKIALALVTICFDVSCNRRFVFVSL